MRPHLAVDVRMIESSGIGTYLSNVVPRVVSELDGIRVTLLGDPGTIERHGWVDDWREGDVSVAVKDVRAPIYSLRQQWHLRRALGEDTDLLWVPHYDVPLFPGTNLLSVVHDVLHLAHPEFVSGIHRRVYARAMFRALRHRAERIVTVSEFSRREIHRYAGISLERIEVIPNGVDASWFGLNRSDGSDTDDDAPFFLYVGNVKPHKNLQRLIQGFERVSGRLPHRLVVVGQMEGLRTGDDRIETLAERARGRVQLRGRVDDDELRGLVSRAAALVLPSVYEGFGLPPLEAMAAGCPVLVSDAGALPEVCGDAALYFDPYDPSDIAGALLECAESPNLRCELTRRGRRRARAFTWERTAEMTAKVIEELVT